MDFSIGKVANKIILAIICISALIAISGVVFFGMNAAFPTRDAAPFVLGVALSMGVNIAKVLLLKRAIIKVSGMASANSAKIYFQVQSFLRILLTAAVFLLAALLPDNIISLWGALIGIFAHPLAMYAIRFFIPADVPMSLDVPPLPEPNQLESNQLEPNQLEANQDGKAGE